MEHVLAVPYPAQGHVIPMMELSKKLIQHGLKVTFVNTDFIHRRMLNALSKNDEDQNCAKIHMVSIPDGLEVEEDRSNLGKFVEASRRVMPVKLEELIQNMNNLGNNIACVVADVGNGWALEVAKRMGIKSLSFTPASATTLALVSTIPSLIQDGIIDATNGTILKKQNIHLSTTMPAMNATTFPWASVTDVAAQKSFFHFLLSINEFLKFADFIICNSAYELEPDAFLLFPKVLPIGPLMASNRLGNQAGNFLEQDSTCLKWLDQQPPCSVIYVAFGSSAILDQTQLQELALGLELTNKPFLWVVRPGTSNKERNEEVYPEGLRDRIRSRGRMVSWAPQEKVLRHPSVSCFVSHCGWNSTTEGLSNGVPFLCWPFYADQFLNSSYICHVWKVGLRLEKDETGIVRPGEIKNKVEQLLGDNNYKSRVTNVKEEIMNSVQVGCSHNNLSSIIKWIRSV